MYRLRMLLGVALIVLWPSHGVAQQAIAWGVAVGEQPLGTWTTPFYSSPNLASASAGQVRSGQMVEIYGAQAGWVYGGLDDGTKGYMPQHLLIVVSATMAELDQLTPSAAQTLLSALYNYRGYCFDDGALAHVFDNSDCTTRLPRFSPNEVALINALAERVPAASTQPDYGNVSEMSRDMHDSTMRVLQTWGGRQCASYETPEWDNCYR